jgi:hypothetical protein
LTPRIDDYKRQIKRLNRGANAGFLAIGIVLLLTLVGRVGSAQQDPQTGIAPLPSRASLDQYGGSKQLPCTNRTGHFILTKIGNHWWFCDAAGHVFMSMSVGNIVTNGNQMKNCNGASTYPIYLAKYGDATFNWGWHTLRRMSAWGFNSVGQDSAAYVQPWYNCGNCAWPSRKQPMPLPYLAEPKPGEYAMINRFGYLDSPIKDEISGTNNNYDVWRGGALFDVFDPGLSTEFKKELANTNQPAMLQITQNSPYLLGIFTDDSDYFTGSGATADFASGHTNANIAWVTLITSPVQTYIQYTPFGGKTLLYQKTRDFSKTLATNPTTPCSISNPCSLRDYLWQKYGGNIGALDKAWGATYTSFDSTGKEVSGENVGTGDGSTTVFTHTLAHTAVSPYSVQFFVGGEAKAGDCPWFHRACGATRSNTGSIGSPNPGYLAQASSNINYSSGAVTITFATPPPKGSSITANYIYGGWMASGTGLMDEDGSHKWVGTNPFCLEGPNPNYPKYFSCVGRGGNHDSVPDANPTTGADLDNWVPQMAAQYFKTMRDDLRAVSKVPYLGLDTIGSWGSPAYSKFLEGASPYVDGAFVPLTYWSPTPSPELFQSAYRYLTQYFGDKPLLDFTVITAQSDSSYYCKPSNGPNNVANQAIRGQMWYNTVQYLLNTPGYNGDTQFVGFDWWSWQDFQGLNQGLVSLSDNAYDGHEAVTAKVPCSPPEQNLPCGNSSGNYGNAIGPISQANAIWYKLLGPQSK